MEERTTSPTLHAVIGAVQGLALWSLHDSLEGHFWPPGSAPKIWALAYCIAMAPTAWQLLPGVFTRASQRVGCALALGLAYALLGAHAGWQNGDAGWGADYSYAFVATVLAFVLLSVIGGWDAPRRHMDYERHFDTAWRNGLLIPLAAAITGLVWALLWAGALLMNAIGLHGLEELLEKRLTIYLVTCTAASWVVGTGLAHPGTLLALRRFVLTLVSWLLPLALVLALCWVAALPFTGLGKLFATRNAASYAFWFTALGVGLLNAAVQDAKREPPYAERLARLVAWGWLCLLPVIVIGDVALAQRVQQHGWTPERVWAAFVGLLLTLYAIGYTGSLVRRAGWMNTVPITNWGVCVVGVAGAILLTTPPGDTHRISVQSQLARLEQGRVNTTDFDWNALARMDRYGRDALRQIAAQESASAASARNALSTYGRRAAPSQPLTSDELQKYLIVLPQGRTADADWLSWANAYDRWQVQRCAESAGSCIVWMKDLDGDGRDEVVLIQRQGSGTEVTFFAQQGGAWQIVGSPTTNASRAARSVDQWRAAIEQGRVELVKPRWPDLRIDEGAASAPH